MTPESGTSDTVSRCFNVSTRITLTAYVCIGTQMLWRDKRSGPEPQLSRGCRALCAIVFSRAYAMMDFHETSTYSLETLQQNFPEDLPSWDFSADVLGQFDHFLDSTTSLEDTTPHESIAPAPQQNEGPSSSTQQPADSQSLLSRTTLVRRQLNLTGGTARWA